MISASLTGRWRAGRDADEDVVDYQGRCHQAFLMRGCTGMASVRDEPECDLCLAGTGCSGDRERALRVLRKIGIDPHLNSGRKWRGYRPIGLAWLVSAVPLRPRNAVN